MSSSEKGVRNFVSRAMKNERVQDALSLGAITAVGYGVIQPFEQGIFSVEPPEVVQGHLLDTVAPFGHAYLSRAMVGRKLGLNTAHSFLGPALVDVIQGVTEYGTFDVKDYVAYGVGTAAYYATERVKSRNRPPER